MSHPIKCFADVEPENGEGHFPLLHQLCEAVEDKNRLTGLPCAAKAELMFRDERVECGSGEGKKPFGVKFVELVHEGDCTMFVKGCGIGVFGDHYGERVVPLLWSGWVTVVSGSGEFGKQLGDLSDLFEGEGFEEQRGGAVWSSRLAVRQTGHQVPQFIRMTRVKFGRLGMLLLDDPQEVVYFLFLFGRRVVESPQVLVELFAPFSSVMFVIEAWWYSCPSWHFCLLAERPVFAFGSFQNFLVFFLDPLSPSMRL